MSENLTKAIFAEQLNTTFRAFYAPEEALELELIEATDPDEHKEVKPKRHERFSLLFRGPQGQVLWHGIYKFQHERMGEFELYLSPVEQDEDGVYYEAVFNRLLPR